MEGFSCSAEGSRSLHTAGVNIQVKRSSLSTPAEQAARA
jgi:hypothetical protein